MRKAGGSGTLVSLEEHEMVALTKVGTGVTGAKTLLSGMDVGTPSISTMQKLVNSVCDSMETIMETSLEENRGKLRRILKLRGREAREGGTNGGWGGKSFPGAPMTTAVSECMSSEESRSDNEGSDLFTKYKREMDLKSDKLQIEIARRLSVKVVPIPPSSASNSRGLYNIMPPALSKFTRQRSAGITFLLKQEAQFEDVIHLLTKHGVNLKTEVEGIQNKGNGRCEVTFNTSATLNRVGLSLSSART
ncbi:hypothetical protein Bbelb_349730 [Branchiostoma belcheri]|nr:hypothetical protein Bbelb_349730 [Branchiostoma belcheri]